MRNSSRIGSRRAPGALGSGGIAGNASSSSSSSISNRDGGKESSRPVLLGALKVNPPSPSFSFPSFQLFPSAPSRRFSLSSLLLAQLSPFFSSPSQSTKRQEKHFHHVHFAHRFLLLRRFLSSVPDQATLFTISLLIFAILIGSWRIAGVYNISGPTLFRKLLLPSPFSHSASVRRAPKSSLSLSSTLSSHSFSWEADPKERKEEELEEERRFQEVERMSMQSQAFRFFHRGDTNWGYLYGWTSPSLSDRIGWPRNELEEREGGNGGGRGERLGEMPLFEVHRVGGVVSRMGVTAFSSSSSHLLALSLAGEVFSLGFNRRANDSAHVSYEGYLGRWGGPDGRAGRVNFGNGALVDNSENDRNISFSEVCAGEQFSLSVSSEGALFSWGRNDRGQLGRDTGGRADKVPRLVGGALLHKRVLSLSCSVFFSLVLTEEGELYTFGMNYVDQLEARKFLSLLPEEREEGGKGGVLGGSGGSHGEKEEYLKLVRALSEPRRIGGALENEQVVVSACGVQHWAVATDEGRVFTASTGFYASPSLSLSPDELAWLGWENKRPYSPGSSERSLGNSYNIRDPALPYRVYGELKDSKIVSLAAGDGVTFAVTVDGNLYSWGKLLNAPLLLGRAHTPQDAHLPGRILEFRKENENGAIVVENDDIKFSAVACGADFALAMTRAGYVYSWGNNEHGQLGRSNSKVDFARPGLIQDLLPFESTRIAAGGAQGYALLHPREEKGKAMIAKEEGNAKTHLFSLISVHNKGSTDANPKVLGDSVVKHEGPFSPRILKEEHKEEILKVGLDLVKSLPAQGFDPRFRNPCWVREGDKISCLPYFMLIGGPRSGANDLFFRLTRSNIPGLMSPARDNPNWWDLGGDQDAESYFQNFQPLAQALETDSELYMNHITGEVSSSIMTFSGVLARGVIERGFTLPEFISAFHSKVKLIIVLRNPIDRMVSDFFSNPSQRETIEPQFSAHFSNCVVPFEQCLEQVTQRTGGEEREVDAAVSKECVKRHFHNNPELVKSLYFYFLRDWLEFFPLNKDQILFLRYEDYVADIKGTIQSVLSFLGLDIPSEDLLNLAAAHPVQMKRQQGQGALVDPTSNLGQKMRHFFDPHNRKLVTLIGGDSRFLWEQ